MRWCIYAARTTSKTTGGRMRSGMTAIGAYWYVKTVCRWCFLNSFLTVEPSFA